MLNTYQQQDCGNTIRLHSNAKAVGCCKVLAIVQGKYVTQASSQAGKATSVGQSRAVQFVKLQTVLHLRSFVVPCLWRFSITFTQTSCPQSMRNHLNQITTYILLWQKLQLMYSKPKKWQCVNSSMQQGRSSKMHLAYSSAGCFSFRSSGCSSSTIHHVVYTALSTTLKPV